MAVGVMSCVPGLVFSISYTTRAPRGSETDGVEYRFVTKAVFERLIQAGELLEWALVYGNYYGTSKGFVDEALAGGRDILFDVDVQGARAIKTKRPEAITVFIMPPSFRTLRERLERRQLDRHYIIENRLKIACEEVRHYQDYDYWIINDDAGKAVDELKAIIVAARCCNESRAGEARLILSTFGGLDDQNP